MKIARTPVILLLIGLACPLYPRSRGYLFIIGGGNRPEGMMRQFVDLAGRFGSGKIIVFPMASSEPAETGAGLLKRRKAVR